jgi:hypothetical protein
MATYNKFNQFTKDLIDGIHDFDAHTFKVMLTNVAPVATNSVKGDLTEITAEHGYSEGGSTTTITTSTSSGTAKATASDVTITASGGTIGPFRYAVLYNDTAASDPLIGWVDYGSSITLQNTELIVIDFDASAGVFTVT